MEMVIDNIKNIVYIKKEKDPGRNLGTIDCAFGNMISAIESFSDYDNYDTAEAALEILRRSFNGQDKVIEMFGFNTSIFAINNIIFQILGNNNEMVFSEHDMNVIRLTYNIQVNDKPLKAHDYECKNGMRFNSINSVVDELYCLLYYYTFNNMKLKRCAHCGKWFAKNSSGSANNEKYCNRMSPFIGYEDRTCKKAVKDIKDMLEKRRISEYERLRLRAAEFEANHRDKFNYFVEACNIYKDKIKKGASVELLQEYKSFLFNSEGLRPKYVRIKNW